MRGTWKRGIWILGALLFASCTNTAETGLLIHIQIDEEVLRPDDSIAVFYKTVEFTSDGAIFGDTTPAFGPRNAMGAPNPIELAFVPRDGQGKDQGVIVAAAILRDDRTLVMQQFAFVYEPGHWGFQEMSLDYTCIDHPCGESETCSYGYCRDVVVFAKDLPTPEQARP